MRWILLLSVLIISSCERSMICAGNKEKGIIEEELKIENCSGTIPDTIGQFIDDKSAEMVITEEYQYELMQTLIDSHPLEFGCVFPSVDFSKNTLLGKYTEGGGCNIDMIRKVKDDEKNKRYVYTIKVKQCGRCKKLGFSMNWVLVPKLPDDYTVEFVVND